VYYYSAVQCRNGSIFPLLTPRPCCSYTTRNNPVKLHRDDLTPTVFGKLYDRPVAAHSWQLESKSHSPKPTQPHWAHGKCQGPAFHTRALFLRTTAAPPYAGDWRLGIAAFGIGRPGDRVAARWPVAAVASGRHAHCTYPIPVRVRCASALAAFPYGPCPRAYHGHPCYARVLRRCDFSVDRV
jgi:hypothetical protein